MILARLPEHGAGTGELAVVIAVEHRAAGQHDGRRVDRCRRHQTSRRGLVAAGHQHHAVERIAVQHFDQAEISEVAVERRGRPLAGLLNWMHRKLERDAAGVADAFAHALGKLQMMAVARAEIGAGLRDADDRLARGQLLAGEAVIEIALEIERGHARIVRIVEPQLRAQTARLLFVRLAIFRHHRLRDLFPGALKCLQCDFRKSRNFPSVDIAILRRRERCAPQIKAGAADLHAILCPNSGFFPPRFCTYCIAI